MSRWYGTQLTRRPLLTQAITTGLLFATGDITAQQLVERRRKDHDFTRTGRMFLYGTAVFGPVAATWFNFLARRVVIPRSKPLQTAARIGCDQLMFAPPMVAVFLSSMAVMEGGSPADKLRRNYVPALTANYYIWPFVQMINFSFVPLRHRLMFVNVISIGWNCYLSYLNSS